MKRKVSEFSYGFVLTHEMVNSFGYLPTDVSHLAKRKKKEEDESAPRGYPLFLQFKASEYMKRRNAGESKLVGLPYFRFALHRKTQSNQHQLLIELEKKGAAVFYATPKIHEAVNLNSAFFDRQVAALSLFVSPAEIGELPDNETHRVVFSNRVEQVYFCPSQQPIYGVIPGERFPEAVRERLAGVTPSVLDDAFYHRIAADMVSLVSPNRRIFDELSRGKAEMAAATFANYLAKTLFDCELLVIGE
ncbi:MAG: hypothetical protein SF339_17105 [Blastocatellia bacterium]|nr:hypothetical protein [Blastocatellia bacterium]